MTEPLYRRIYDAAQLLREHPPRFHHPHKRGLFEIAYPEGAATSRPVEVTRWGRFAPATLSLAATPATEVRPDFYDYVPASGESTDADWHVNFADPRLFFAYGSPLFAQDEMQVAEHPLLACVREALVAEGLSAMTIDGASAAPILVCGVERRIAVATNPDAAAGRPAGLYGNRFAAAPFDAVRRATRRIEPPSISNIAAMAAPSGGRGEYSREEIADIFATAHTAFAAARRESGAPTVIHTGLWGCGAFGGNRTLMTALQALAARAAGATRIVFHAGDAAGAKDADRGLEVAENLAARLGLSPTMNDLVERTASFGYRWGVGDGN